MSLRQQGVRHADCFGDGAEANPDVRACNHVTSVTSLFTPLQPLALGLHLRDSLGDDDHLLAQMGALGVETGELGVDFGWRAHGRKVAAGRGKVEGMSFDGLPHPHEAVLMEGIVWRPDEPGFTAMCIGTHDVGTAGPAECETLGYKVTEANMIRLSVHMLNCNCGWSHVLGEAASVRPPLAPAPVSPRRP